MNAVYATDFKDLKMTRRGKVRDVYDLGEYLLIVAADRISAFDVVMNEAIPGKGKVLSKISEFWFKATKDLMPNHYISCNVDDYPEVCHKYKDELEGRSMLVKKCKPLPIECIVRGYIAGSGWKTYQKDQTVCGINLPGGLLEFGQLPEPLFTPSTKADEGHDENITFDQAVELCGLEVTTKVKELAIKLYKFGAEHLEKNGLILADTKFEFGIDANNEVILIDEALTPDSSRFWSKDEYAPGKAPVQFDKQIMRDYLSSLSWNKQAPAPTLTQEIIDKTVEKYDQAKGMIIK
ncbi:MAG: phosphoribosylaminoimidazolesuccinocarboxamide synthase [Chlorobi bacterium]|nr:phosphoribosylaminoimidazolesuccinocarboxamide synthase [Chlorobiota bacterium]